MLQSLRKRKTAHAMTWHLATWHGREAHFRADGRGDPKGVPPERAFNARFVPAGTRQVHPTPATRAVPMTMRKIPFPAILIACNLLLIGGFASCG